MKPSELKDILDQHRLWIESDRKQGKGADLRGANLRGANLYGANLWNAYLPGADLQYADLQYADLQYANLQGANLQGATFTTNFKKVGWFEETTFSEDQIAWVCLHLKFGEWESTLKWVKASADAA